MNKITYFTDPATYFTIWDFISFTMEPSAIAWVRGKAFEVNEMVSPALQITIKSEDTRLSMSVLPLGWGDNPFHQEAHAGCKSYTVATADLKGRSESQQSRLNTLLLLLGASTQITGNELKGVARGLIDLAVPFWLDRPELWYKYGIDIAREMGLVDH